MPKIVFFASLVVSYISLVDSSLADQIWPPPYCIPERSVPIYKVVYLPKGVGIKRVEFGHERDENTYMHGFVAIGKQVEHIENITLERRDVKP
jgi:hypothetical protein